MSWTRGKNGRGTVDEESRAEKIEGEEEDRD